MAYTSVGVAAWAALVEESPEGGKAALTARVALVREAVGGMAVATGMEAAVVGGRL